MRRTAVVLLSLSAVVGGLFVAPAAQAAPVPEAPYTVLGVQASAGSSLGTANESGGAVEAVGSSVTSSTLTTSTATFAASGAISLALYAPTGGSWQAGQVYSIDASRDTTHAAARVAASSNRSCTTASSGSITVREAVTTGTQVTAFAADVEVDCGASNYSAYVRWNSTVGYAGLTLAGSVSYPTVDLGGYTDRTVTLTATGTDPLPFISDATFGGTEPDAFSVVGDDCKQQALAAGSSCSIVVRARPLSPGFALANLVLVHDTASPWEVPLLASAREVATGTFHSVTPRRILDTRTGLGGRKGPLGTNGLARLNVSSGLGGPASAVVLNLTVDRPAAAGYLTAFPSGTARPVASSINFAAGQTLANLVTVPVGTGGNIDIVNYSGSTSVVADLVGWYSSSVNATSVQRGGGYHPKNVERLFDTRDGYGKLAPNSGVLLGVYYNGDQNDIAAMSTNITAVKPAAQGYLTAWNGASAPPSTSTLNFAAGAGVVSNAAIVPVSYGDPDCPRCAEFAVINRSAASIDVVVDINGFFDAGNLPAEFRYQPLGSPTRIVDTRLGLGATTLGTSATRTVSAPTTAAGYDTVALDSNVTAVSPTNQTYVTVWPTFDDYPRPLASSLNPNARQTVANHVIAEVGFGNRFNLYNFLGTTNLLVDVSGTFEYFPHTPADQIPRGKAGAPSVSRAAPPTDSSAGRTKPVLLGG